MGLYGDRDGPLVGSASEASMAKLANRPTGRFFVSGVSNAGKEPVGCEKQ